MTSLQTPLHRVEGLGAAHSGTMHFWRQRVTAAALLPLSLWFAFIVLGLAGAGEAATVGILSRSWNAIFMGAFVLILLYHMVLGLQVVIDDYVVGAGGKIFFILIVRAAAIAIGAVSLFSLIRIAAL